MTIGLDVQGPGVDPAETPAHRSGPHEPLGVRQQGHDPVIGQSVGLPFHMAKGLCGARDRIDECDACAEGCDPQPPGVVLREGVDIPAARRGTGRRHAMAERPGARTPLAQPGLGAHPQQTTTIFEQGANVVVREAVRIGGVEAVGLEVAVLAVEQREAAVGTHPEPTAAVLKKRADGHRRQTARRLANVPKGLAGAGVGVEPLEAEIRADPNTPVRLDQQRVHLCSLQDLCRLQDLSACAHGFQTKPMILDEPRGSVQVFQPASRADPQAVRAVLRKGIDRIDFRVRCGPESLQRVVDRVVRDDATLTSADPERARVVEVECSSARDVLIFDGGKATRVRISPRNTSSVGGDPQPSCVVESYGSNPTTRQTVITRAVMSHVFESVSVVAIQAVFCGEPQEACRVLSNERDVLLREALVEAEPLEAHRVRVPGVANTHGRHPARRRRNCGAQSDAQREKCEGTPSGVQRNFAPRRRPCRRCTQEPPLLRCDRSVSMCCARQAGLCARGAARQTGRGSLFRAPVGTLASACTAATL